MHTNFEPTKKRKIGAGLSEPNSKELREANERNAALELENVQLRRKLAEREFDKMSKSVQSIIELTDRPSLAEQKMLQPEQRTNEAESERLIATVKVEYACWCADSDSEKHSAVQAPKACLVAAHPERYAALCQELIRLEYGDPSPDDSEEDRELRATLRITGVEELNDVPYVLLVKL